MIVDLNVAEEVDPKNPVIQGGIGLREWSAPETRTAMNYDLTCDCWTVGCVMYLLCTGLQPFEAGKAISKAKNLNVLKKLLPFYGDSNTFVEMQDFLGKLIQPDLNNRLTAQEALKHKWLNAQPYLNSPTLKIAGIQS